MKHKYLYVVAAGQADEHQPVMNELKRSLSTTGVQQVLSLLEFLKEHPIHKPDLILCSPCLYVCQTMDLLHEVLAGIDVVCKDTLYSAPDYRILETINNLDDILSSVMIVGELPGLKQFLGYVDRLSDQKKLKPGQMVTLVLNPDVSWHDFGCAKNKVHSPRRIIKLF